MISNLIINSKKIASLFCLCMIYSCGNVMPLTGGVKDITPPKLIITKPENLKKNFKENKIVLSFDENITGNSLNKIYSSPPIKEIKHKIKGNKIELYFDENELTKATYLILLDQALKDVNEGNVLNNLDYVFSTEDTIDSLYFSGFVRDAYLGISIPDIWVLLYKENVNDSAIFNEPPSYLARTDSLGFFSFKYLDNFDYVSYAISGLDLQFNTNDKIGFKKNAISKNNLDSIIYLFDPLFKHDSIVEAQRDSQKNKNDSIKIKTGDLRVNLSETKDVIIELSKNDAVKFLASFNKSICIIKDLEIGQYSMKIFLDSNQNGSWDTGSLDNKIQPERSLLYDEKINIRENWDLELSWKINEL